MVGIGATGETMKQDATKVLRMTKYGTLFQKVLLLAVIDRNA